MQRHSTTAATPQTISDAPLGEAGVGLVGVSSHDGMATRARGELRRGAGRPDPAEFAAARGLVVGLLLGLCAWAAIGLVVVVLVRAAWP